MTRRVKAALYATVVTTLGLFAGAWGSLYSSEIRSAWPFVWGPYDGVSRHSVFFWSLVLSATLLFFWGQVAVADQAARLEELIRTQPPEDFLALCASLNNQCFAIHDALKYSSSSGKTDPQGIIQSIRLVLWTFVILAKEFDRSPKAVRYAANVMVFRETQSLSPDEKVAVKKRLTFCDPDVSVDNLRGVLDLRRDLSTTSRLDDGSPDPDLKPMALPVTRQDHPDRVLHGETTYRSRLLPGAPRAFYKQGMECYLDTSKLADWCKTKGDFSPGIEEQIDEYFRNHDMGSHVKSFVSLPLRNPQSGEMQGVLNLHRNEVGMLKAEGLARQFMYVVTPNLLTLERLLMTLASVEASGAP
jgi:hypothetical protein